MAHTGFAYFGVSRRAFRFFVDGVFFCVCWRASAWACTYKIWKTGKLPPTVHVGICICIHIGTHNIHIDLHILYCKVYMNAQKNHDFANTQRPTQSLVNINI